MTTTSMAGRRRAAHHDEGASLILALALVLLMSLIVGGLVTYAGTSVNAVSDATAGVQHTYDVDGALQTAVNAVRTSTYNQDEGEACLDDGLLEVPTAGTGRVVVRCSPEPGTGADSGLVRIDDSNRLLSAIHAGSGGITQVPTAATLVRGDVKSRAQIDVQGTACAPDAAFPGNTGGCAGLWDPWAQISASGSCTGTLVSQPAAVCGGSVSGLPSYAQPANTLTYRTVPSSCPSGSRVEFQPGYYDDAVALSSLMNGTCNKTFLFRPGTYYFDFRNEDAGLDPWPVPSGSNEWLISGSDVRVVGGEPEGSEPLSFPGGCTSPLEDEGADGVTFVFGGTSRMRVTAGSVELCGSYRSGSPPIAVFGATADQGASSATTSALPTSGTPGPFSPSDSWPLARAAQFSRDGNLATATLTRQPDGSRSVRAIFSGYSPNSTVPAGSIVTSATLVLRHRETNTIWYRDSLDVSINLPGPGGYVSVAEQPSLTGDFRIDHINLATQDFVDRVHANGFTGADISYRVSSGPGSGDVLTAVDEATIELTFIPPRVRQETTSSGTTLISTSGSARFRVPGAIYAPRAAFDLRLSGVDYSVVGGGLVTRQLTMGISATSGFKKPVIQTPEVSAGRVPVVLYFTAYSCDGTCSGDPPSAGWTVAGTSSAAFVDAGTLPVANSRKVIVKSWQLGG